MKSRKGETMDRNEGNHPPFARLEAFLSGALAPVEETELQSHLESCAHCAAYVREAPGLARDFSRKYPTFAALEQRCAPEARIREERGLLLRLRETLAALLAPKPAFALVTAALLLSVGLFWGRGRGTAADLSVKGKTDVLLWVNGKRAEKGPFAVRPGDTLQFGVVGSKPLHYAVFYKDDKGPISRYMPTPPETAAPLGSPGCDLLPHSIILGGGWKEETIHVLLSEKPLDSAASAQFLEKAPADGKTVIRKFVLKNREAPKG